MNEHRSPAASPWEWVAAIVSTLIVLSLIGYMLREGLTKPAAGPDVRVEVAGVARAGEQHRVDLRVINRGHGTAAGLRLKGELETGAGVERSEVTLDYLPGQGEREASLWFTGDPRRGRLRVRPTGHRTP